MKNNNSLQSITFDAIRFPLVIMVVFIHCFGLPNEFTPLCEVKNFNYDEVFTFIRIFFSKVFPHIAVPTFFIMSSYLLFRSFNGIWDFNQWSHKVKRRIKSLLIPYLIWNMIPILFYIATVIGGAIIHNKPIQGLSEPISSLFSWHTYWDIKIDGSLTGPMNYPLWFIRDLMVHIILSPLIFIYIKTTKIYGILFVLLYYLLGFNFISIPGLNFFVTIFFVMGSYLALNKIDIIEQFKKYSNYIHPICIVSLFIAVYTFGSNLSISGYSFRIYIITGIISLFTISGSLCKKYNIKGKTIVTSSTFFVYAAHLGLPMQKSANIIVNSITDIVPPVICYFLVPFITIFLCVLMYIILNSISPRLTTFVCGR